jgi:hypothetical protein
MIVVIGSPLLAPGTGPERAQGLCSSIARAAAQGGAAVQLVGKVGDDPDGDAVLLALAQAGIGHVAVLRDPAHRTPRASVLTDAVVAPDSTAVGAGASVAAAMAQLEAGTPTDTPPPERLPLEAADVELALRYLVDYRVVVVAELLGDAAGRVVADAAAFASAETIVVVQPGFPPPATLAAATVLEGPDDDEGPFAELIGRLAAALDRGEPPAGALEAAIGAVGWEPVEA